MFDHVTGTAGALSSILVLIEKSDGIFLITNLMSPLFNKKKKKSSSQKTCCTHPLRRKRGGTRRSVLFRVPTLTSWMWNVQDATRSRQCSATLRQSCCAWAVQQSCVSPLEAKHVSQRGAHSGGSSTSCSSLELKGRGGDGPVDISSNAPETAADPAVWSETRLEDGLDSRWTGQQMNFHCSCRQIGCCCNSTLQPCLS